MVYWVLTKGQMQFNGRTVVSIKGAGTIGCPNAKSEPQTMLQTYTKINSKWVMGLNKNVKL